MNRTFSPFAPLLLLMVSIIFPLSFQIHFARSYGSSSRDERKLREPIVAQTQATQVTLEKLATGLLDLVPDDAAARAIIGKHQIRLAPKKETSADQS